MNKKILKKLTATMLVSAGILAINVDPLLAQTQGSSSTGTQTQSGRQGTTSGRQGADKSMQGNSAISMFIQKAAEANVAEIDLGRIAMQKASSQQVKDFAQQMIDHHSMAQEQLASLVSGTASTNPGRSGAGSTGSSGNDTNANDSNASDDANTGTTSGNGTSATSGTGSTSGSGTLGSGSGTTGSGTTGNTSGTTGNMGSTSGMYQNLPTELSSEHKAMRSKLEKLSGKEFDRQYMQAMVQDHAKSVALFEKQANSNDDIALQSFASKTLPIIRQHYTLAQQLSDGKSTGSGASGSGTGTGSGTSGSGAGTSGSGSGTSGTR